MADDDRRAEIEAVRRVLYGEDGADLPDGGMAEAVIAALGRVRDARGDDEATKDLRRKGFHEAAAEVEDRKRTFFAPHSGHDVEAARSPQGEDPPA